MAHRFYKKEKKKNFELIDINHFWTVFFKFERDNNLTGSLIEFQIFGPVYLMLNCPKLVLILEENKKIVQII